METFNRSLYICSPSHDRISQDANYTFTNKCSDTHRERGREGGKEWERERGEGEGRERERQQAGTLPVYK